MGNCRFTERRSVRNHFDFMHLQGKKASLVFKIKTWPSHQALNLKDSQNCTQRLIEACLQGGEKIQINLKSQYEKIQGWRQSNKMIFNLHCRIEKNDQGYAISFPLEDQKKYLWKYASRYTELGEGDIVKMGNTKYKLVKLINQKGKGLKNTYQLQQNDGAFKRCRVCLQSAQCKQNPLISACMCGKYIHPKCLSRLVFQLEKVQNQCLVINTNKSICQLCKMDLTSTWKQQQMGELLLQSANHIPTPYCIFLREQRQERKYLLLPFTSRDSFTFGRSNKADILDQHDKCISKLNTKIKYRDARLMVQDMESTHGTFIKVRSGLKLDAFNRQEDIIYRNMLIKAQYLPTFDKQ